MESNHKHYHKTGMREGDPGQVNPENTSQTHPAKTDSSEAKLKIKESGHGREVSQMPADEHIESFSQINGPGTGFNEDPTAQATRKEFDTTDANRIDTRDPEDSTEDWDAEKSRTGRQK